MKTNASSRAASRRIALSGILVSIIALFDATVAQADAPSVPLATQGSVTDPSAGVPESGGQTSTALLASPSVDPSTGILHTSLRIESPPARGAAQPDVSISYSSEGGVGYVGFGWDLGTPTIERHPISGTPSYEALPTTSGPWVPKDQFVADGRRLVPVCRVQSGLCGTVAETFPASLNGWWYFREAVDDSFRRYFLSPDELTWLVQSKQGVTIELGHPLLPSFVPSSAVPDAVEYPGNERAPQVGPYRWHIVRKYDAQIAPSGPPNIVYYIWVTDTGTPGLASDARLYLGDVYDTAVATRALSRGFSLADFAHHIAFHYESPSWIPPTSFRSPVQRQQPYKRLSGVDVTSALFGDPTRRELVRRYHFAYHEDRTRSFLDSVQVEGRCSSPVYETDTAKTPYLPATSCSKRPATSFTYEASTESAIAWNPRPLLGGVPPSAYLADINSDGLPDFVGPGDATTPGWVALNGTLAPDNVAVFASIDVKAFATSGATNANFFPDPKATSLAFTAGNYLANGSISVGWFTTYNGNPELHFFTPQPSGTNWYWTPIGYKSDLGLTKGTLSVLYSSCTGDNQGAQLPYITDETPYGTADVDGDAYPDLLTYTVFGQATCGVIIDANGQPVPTPLGPFSFSVGIGIHATQRHPDGSISPIEIPKGTIPPPSWAASLLPAGALYANLVDSSVVSNAHLIPEDVNGDGLVDVINAALTGVTVAYGRGDGTISTPENASIQNAPLVSLEDVYLHDVNGDGMADVVVKHPSGIVLCLNKNGLNFDYCTFEPTPANVPTWNFASAQVLFGDVNGSGVEDIVVVQSDSNRAWYADLLGGHRPGLLTGIDNGQGAKTTLTYASTTDLQYAAFKSGVPWSRHMSQVLHHVTSISTTNGMAAPYGATKTTQYVYTDPIYDPRDESFVGFNKVRTIHTGAGDDPSSYVDTTFLSGICEVDGGNCPGSPSADRPYLALRGRPVLVESSDGAGHYLSTVHTTWQVDPTQSGTDGTRARLAYPSNVDTYLYDTAAPSSSTTALVRNDFCVSDQQVFCQPRQITLHGGTGQFAHLQRVQVESSQGNVTQRTDYGDVDSDQAISLTSTWYLPPGDTTGWLWRKNVDDVAPFNEPGPFYDEQRHAVYAYDASGNLKSVTAMLQGEAPLTRLVAAGITPAPTPSIASQNGTIVEIVSYDYDSFGNRSFIHGPRSATCEGQVYDTPFQQFVITDEVFTQSPATCSGAALTTSYAYDRGLAATTMVTAPDFSYTTTSYDTFGRPQTTSKNATDAPALLGTNPQVINTYAEYDPLAKRPSYVYTQAWDGTAYRKSYTFSDGLGQPLVTLKQAATSDAPWTWVVSGIKQRGANGHVLNEYAPYFTTTDPLSFTFTPIPTIASRHTKYDAFGRPVLTKNLAGAQDSETHYHALSTDTFDAMNLPSSGHGAYLTSVKDGHGRVVQSIVRGRIGSSQQLSTITTSNTYTVTGERTAITRSDGTTSVVQNLKYDSLDRLVENQEPNTTSSGLDWRYVYDDAGNMIATSDPRGCGENVTFDAAGRKITEDFSPCVSYHAAYTAPQGDGGGYEVIFGYDAPMNGQNPSAPDGHLHTMADRASLTLYGYDARGRVTHVDRGLARPDAPSSVTVSPSGVGQMYAANDFAYDVQYDDADRVVSRSTGATAPGMLAGGQSVVRTHYDERGNVQLVDGSYGTLLSSTRFDADGLPLKYVYADNAKTTTSFDYDSLRRLLHTRTTRPSSFAATNPPGTSATEEEALEEMTFGYDPVGNPTLVQDQSDTDPTYPTAWPAGARPIHTKSISYDDLYHVRQVTYDTAGDVFTQPFAAEFAAENAGETIPMSPVPATVLPARVTSQTFDYDWLGNMSSSDDDQHAFYDRSLGTITEDTVAPNQFESSTGPNGSTYLRYDAAGNVTNVFVRRSSACTVTGKCTGEQFTYTWDELGRLLEAKRWDQIPRPGLVNTGHGAIDVTYAYDGNGTRVLKTSIVNGRSPTYGAEIFPTLRIDDATWNATTSKYQDDETTEGVYLFADKSPIARLAYATSDPRTATSGALHVFFEIKDALGSSSIVVDKDTSELVEKTTYQPYGAVESDYRTPRWQSFREPYKFTGKEEDVGLGIAYFGARYYAPALGRWLSPDPVAIHSQQGDPDPYAYAAGRVFKVTDPTGLYNVADYGAPDASDWQSWTQIADSTGRSTIPGYDALGALASANLGDAFLDGLSNSISDPLNALSNALGLTYTVPTLAPGPSSNPFESMAYSAGGLTGQTAILEGLGAGELLGKGVGAVYSWTEGTAGSTAPVLASALTKAGPDLGEIAENIVPSGACFTGATTVLTPHGEVAIASLRAGDRVLSAGDEIQPDDQTSVDPRTWRDVHVRLPNPDGSRDVIEIEMLRSLEWTGEIGAVPGRWIPISLAEMGLRGVGEVTDVGDVTHLEPGPGRVVLATVTHLNGEILALSLKNGEVIEPTRTHWLSSPEHRGWVEAAELRAGDHLTTASGSVAIVDLRREPGVQRVFNLEVETTHSYFVGESRVLSHNVCAGGLGALGRAEAAAPTIPRLMPGSLPAEEEGAVLRTLGHIDNGTIPQGPTATRWGIPFKNTEGNLPGAKGALPTPYTEYRVAPGPGISGAGARRIVVDNASGSVFYSWTHYGQAGDPAFLKIR